MFLKIIGAICETLYGLLKAFALVGILGLCFFLIINQKTQYKNARNGNKECKIKCREVCDEIKESEVKAKFTGKSTSVANASEEKALEEMLKDWFEGIKNNTIKVKNEVTDKADKALEAANKVIKDDKDNKNSKGTKESSKAKDNSSK